MNANTFKVFYTNYNTCFMYLLSVKFMVKSIEGLQLKRSAGLRLQMVPLQH